MACRITVVRAAPRLTVVRGTDRRLVVSASRAVLVRPRATLVAIRPPRRLLIMGAATVVGVGNVVGTTTPVADGDPVVYSGITGFAIRKADPGEVLSSADHEALRHLVHFLDDGPGPGMVAGPCELVTTGGAFPSALTWYADSPPTIKLVELLITRNGSQLPILEVWRMYDTDGSTVLATVTDTIDYSGGIFNPSRVRAFS